MAVAPSPRLRLGSRGPDVTRLQERLTELGFNPGSSDGIYGSQTLRALSDFQRRAGLPVTGIVDAATWAALFADSQPITDSTQNQAAPAIGAVRRPADIKALPNGLVMALFTRRFRYRSGESVEFILLKYNRGRENIVLNYPTSQRFNFSIRDIEGNQVWQWSAGRTFLPVLGQVRLEPNEAQTYRAAWDIPAAAPAGAYLITGWNVAEQLTEQRLQIRIQVE